MTSLLKGRSTSPHRSNPRRLRYALVAIACAGLFALARYLRPHDGAVQGTSPTQGKTLVLYNWVEYMDPRVLEDFERETGIRVVEEFFDSNETVRAKLIAGATGYDVVVPSSEVIKLLVDADLLHPLDPAKLPGRANLAPTFRKMPFDREERFTVPYLWVATGIGYRRDLVSPPPQSWGDLLLTERIVAQSKKISMLASPRDALGAALKYLGTSANDPNPDRVAAAKDLLLKQKAHLARYDSETYAELMRQGDLTMAQGWSGTFVKAQREDSRIEFVIPEEGGLLSVDCLVIPRSSEKVAEAHLLIDFLLRPENAARIVETVYYPTPNAEARKHLSAEIANHPLIFPAAPTMDRLEWLEDVGPAVAHYDRAWKEVRLRR